MWKKERWCFALVTYNLLFLWYTLPSSVHTELIYVWVCVCVCVCGCLRVHVDLNILDRLTWCNFLILYLWLSLHNLSVETSLFSSLSFNLCQYSSLLNSHLFSSVFLQLFYVSFMNLSSAITLMNLINKCAIKAIFARHYHLPPH